jgi:hypothetical protein
MPANVLDKPSAELPHPTAQTRPLPEKRGILMPDWNWRAVSQIASMTNLRPNWDGYGAEPVSLAAIQTALGILARMTVDVPEPYVLPTPLGGVQFEWHPRGIDLELEARADGNVGFLLIDHASDQTTEGEVSWDAPDISKMLSALVHSHS